MGSGGMEGGLMTSSLKLPNAEKRVEKKKETLQLSSHYLTQNLHLRNNYIF